MQLEANLTDKGITLASPRALLQVTESLSSFRPLIILNFISVCSKVLNWLNVILKEEKIEVKSRSNIKHEGGNFEGVGVCLKFYSGERKK